MRREKQKGFELEFALSYKKVVFSILFESACARISGEQHSTIQKTAEFGEWFVKFGPKLGLICFKNSVHLGAEKYMHVRNVLAPNILAVQGNGEKNSLGKTWLCMLQ